MILTYHDQTLELQDGITGLECLKAFGCGDISSLALVHNQHLMELDESVRGDGTIRPVTLQEPEGRRIYERSIRYVLLMAMEKVFPGQQVRFEYSVRNGILLRLPGHPLSSQDVKLLKESMLDFIRQDLPFEKQMWKTQDASAYFGDKGQKDKVQLLRYRPLPMIRMYGCGGIWEYFYGIMVPSTGYVPVFDLLLHGTSLILLLPNSEYTREPAPYIERPHLMETFSQSARWCSILGVNNVSDLTRLMERRELRSFIRVNEALHDHALVDCAREIATRRKRIVLVAGPSSSGKTTFAGRLAIQLQVLGYKAHRISLDNYYLNRDQIPREKDGSVDLEHIRTLDLDLLQKQTLDLLKGRKVEIPEFSFRTGRREKRGNMIQLADQDIVIFEGIHALNPMLSEGMPEPSIYRIFVSDLTCLNLDDHNRIRTTDMRLLRRIVRDWKFRGTSPEETLAMWPSVRRGEETWIFPYQEMADTFFNTTLHYELPVLRHFAYGLLEHPDPDWEGYLLAMRLKKTLNYIPDIDENILSEIPPLSLLREFIGGSTMDLT